MPFNHRVRILGAKLDEWKRLNAWRYTVPLEKISEAFNSISSKTSENCGGALEGKLVGVKDNLCVKDMPATAGSKMLESFVAPYDATVVERLRNAGSIIIGKTNMDEFGMGSYGVNSAFGPTFAPQENGSKDAVAGGSSSGSTAAVAADVVDFALGSDTGGSIRLPAALCGVVGFKPSYGRLSRHGLISYASSLDCVGIISKDIQVVIDVMEATQGPDGKDATCFAMPWTSTLLEKPKIRIGIPSEYFVEELSSSVLDLWKGFGTDLTTRLPVQVELVPVEIPSLPHSLPAYYVIACAEAASNLSRYDGVEYGYRSSATSEELGLRHASVHEDYIESRSHGFGNEVQKRILMGSYVLSSEAYDDYYMKAVAIRKQLRREFDHVFNHVDILLTPVRSGSGPMLFQNVSLESSVESYLTDVMTVPASLAGLPSISLPSTTYGANIQLMAGRERDLELLQFAQVIQKSKL